MSNRYEVQVDPQAVNNPHAFALAFVGSGHRVLEIGCSTGHVTTHLVAAGNEVTGVELDEDAAARARTVTPTVHVVDLDAAKVSDIESPRFDVILLGDVLEHVREPGAVLADIVTLLEPQGRLVISVPNLAHADVRLMLLEGRVEYQDDGLLDRTHLRWFTKDSLRTLLADTGFVAVRVNRVIFPTGASNVPFTPAAHSEATLEFIGADPESNTYQYVVECRRSAETAERDVLEPQSFDWPDPDVSRALVADQRAEISRLRAELEAWEHSRVARWSRPVRSASARARRLAGRLRS